MTIAGRRGARGQASEEVVAAARVVLGLSIAVGAMAALMGVASAQPIALLAIPTLVLGLGILRGWLWLAGWSGVGVWLILLPSVHGEALVAPLVMSVLCAAIGIGPERFAAWLGRDFAGSAVGRGGDGWIEEDGRPLD